MKLRQIKESDYDQIIGELDNWWGGRHMSDMLPRLFFRHFSDTGFAAEEKGRVIAFIIGFLSQASPDHSYVHFTGIHPDFRKTGLGRRLYEAFFDAAKLRGCKTVQLVTSPVNKNSIAFHTHIGFRIKEGDCMMDGIPVHKNYDGPGEDRVVFIKGL